MIAFNGNPDGCLHEDILAEHGGDCIACHFSHVGEDNVWHGPQDCYRLSRCLVFDPERSSPCYSRA